MKRTHQSWKQRNRDKKRRRRRRRENITFESAEKESRTKGKYDIRNLQTASEVSDDSHSLLEEGTKALNFCGSTFTNFIAVEKITERERRVGQVCERDEIRKRQKERGQETEKTQTREHIKEMFRESL